MRTPAVLLGLALALGGGCRPNAPPPDPRAHAEGLYVYATSLYLKGDLEGALQAFEEMQSITPEDRRLPAALGEVLLAQGRLNDALTQFEVAARQDPGRSTNWSRMGFIQSTVGRDEEARRSLHKALELNPRDSVALEALGELELRAEEVEAAVEHLARAADAATTPAQANALRIRAAQALTGAGRQGEAIRLLSNASALGGVDVAVLTELGELLVREERFEEARRAFAEAARRDSADPSLWETVGELDLALRRPAEAAAAYRASLKVKDRATVRLALARAHRARGETAAALDELQKALAVASGDDASETHELAKALVLFDRKKDALALLEVLAREPDAVSDVALQLETARLAQELGRAEVLAAACARVRKAGSALRSTPCRP